MQNGYFSPYGNPKLEDGKAGEFLTNRLTKEATQFINQNKSKPFFLNLWFYAVHTPLQAEKDKINKYEAKLNQSNQHKNPTYAAMIEHMDDAVGKIMQTLKELNLDKNTIIVFTSDNGGLIGNHPRFKEKVTSNYPLKSGKGDMYEGGVRVPTIIYYPSKIKSKVINTPITSIDYLPTLLDLTNINIVDKSQFDGISLENLITKNKPIKERPMFWHYPHYHTEGAVPYSAVRFKNFKLIHNLENDSIELYNLENDVAEKFNIAFENEKLSNQLFEMLQKWKITVNAQDPLKNLSFKK
ncbi:MAG: sulfatase-like hydrolase/transferase [Polaribacter sp.]|nr:sulfatase-like hydrolase/transferase [Polaribacter sp.]